jgi:hypothetical protein
MCDCLCVKRTPCHTIDCSRRPDSCLVIVPSASHSNVMHVMHVRTLCSVHCCILMCTQVLGSLDSAADAYSRAAAAFAACYGRADARASTVRAACKKCRRTAAEKRTTATATAAASSRASSAGKFLLHCLLFDECSHAQPPATPSVRSATGRRTADIVHTRMHMHL